MVAEVVFYPIQQRSFLCIHARERIIAGMNIPDAERPEGVDDVFANLLKDHLDGNARAREIFWNGRKKKGVAKYRGANKKVPHNSFAVQSEPSGLYESPMAANKGSRRKKFVKLDSEGVSISWED